MSQIKISYKMKIPEKLTLTDKWDKVFPLSDKVSYHKVTYVNRYGITLVADLYTPKNIKGKLAGLAVGSPYGAVKKQAGGIYAIKKAERGYVTLVFDPSFNGESGGNVRLVSSPDINTEDFCASVDCLVCLENVDHNHDSRYEEIKKLSLMRSKDVQNGNYTNQPSLNLVLKML